MFNINIHTTHLRSSPHHYFVRWLGVVFVVMSWMDHSVGLSFVSAHTHRDTTSSSTTTTTSTSTTSTTTTTTTIPPTAPNRRQQVQQLDMDSLRMMDDDRYNNGPNENNVTNAPYVPWTRSPTVTPLNPSVPTLSPSAVPSISHSPSSYNHHHNCTSLNGQDFGDVFSNDDAVELQLLAFTYQVEMDPTYDPNGATTTNTTTSKEEYIQTVILPQLELYMLQYLIPHLFEQCDPNAGHSSSSSSSSSSIPVVVSSLLKAISTQPKDVHKLDAECITTTISTTTTDNGIPMDCIPVHGIMSFYIDISSSTTPTTTTSSSSSSSTTTEKRSSFVKTIHRSIDAQILEIKQIILSLIQNGMELDLFVPAHEAITKVIYIESTNPGVMDDDDDNNDEDDENNTTNTPDAAVPIGTGTVVGIAIGAIALVSFCVFFAATKRRRRSRQVQDEDMKDADEYINVKKERNDPDYELDDIESSTMPNHPMVLEQESSLPSPPPSSSPSSSSSSPSSSPPPSKQEETTGNHHNGHKITYINSNDSGTIDKEHGALESYHLFPDWDYDRNQNHQQEEGHDIHLVNIPLDTSIRDDGAQHPTIPIIGNDTRNHDTIQDTRRSKEQQQGKEIHVEALLNQNDARHQQGAKKKRDRQSSSANVLKSFSSLTQAESDRRNEVKNHGADTDVSRGNGKSVRIGPTTHRQSKVRMESQTANSLHEKSISNTFDSNRAVGRNERSVHTNEKSDRSKHERSVRDSSIPGPFQFLYRSRQPTTTIQQSAQGSFDFFDLILDDGVGNGPDQDSHISDVTF